MSEFHLGEEFLDNMELDELDQETVQKLMDISDRAGLRVREVRLGAGGHKVYLSARRREYENALEEMVNLLGPLEEKLALRLLLDYRAADISTVTWRRMELVVRQKILDCFGITEQELKEVRW